MSKQGSLLASPSVRADLVCLLVLSIGCNGSNNASDPEPAPADPSRTPASASDAVESPDDAATGQKQLRALANPTCVIRDGAMSVALYAGSPQAWWKLYAVVDADAVELRMADGAATVTATNTDVELFGDASKTDREFPIWVRPRRDVLFDGWIRVERARIVEVEGAQATLEFGLPSLIGQPRMRKTLPCEELTQVPFPRRAPGGKASHLRPSSKIDLRITRDGAVVATFETHAIPRIGRDTDEFAVNGAIDGLAVRVLAREGGDAQIELSDSTTSVIGWIRGGQLARHRKLEIPRITGTGSLVDYRAAPPKATFRCAHEVDIFRGHIDVIRVGMFRPSASIRVLDESGPERRVDLGASWDEWSRRIATDAPYVHASEIADCTPTQ